MKRHVNKRVISIMLTIAVLAPLLSASVPAAGAAPDVNFGTFHNNMLEWELTTDHTLTIRLNTASATSHQAMPNFTAANRPPWDHHRDQITNVIISAGVTSIGNHTFNGYRYLVNVNAPGVNRIGDSAFRDCINLSSVTAPEVEIIGNYAFYGCRELVDISHPADSRSGINLYNAVSIGEFAFAGCVGINTLRTHLNDGQGFSTPHDRYVTIGRNAFDGCTRLEAAYTPNVISIGAGAYNGCSDLDRVWFPGTMTSFGDGVFTGCGNLNEINVGSVTGVTPPQFGAIRLADDIPGIGPGLIYGEVTGTQAWQATIVKALDAAGAVSIPGLVEIQELGFVVSSIGTEAFRGSRSLASVTIPSTVTRLGLNAFSDCDALNSAIFQGRIPATPGGNRIFEGAADEFMIYHPPGLNWPASRVWNNYPLVPVSDSITLNTYFIEMREGDTAELRATVHPSGTSPVVTWEVINQLPTDPGDVVVAHVTAGGIVHGLNPGWAIVVVTSADGKRLAACTIHVMPKLIPATRVVLSHSRIEMTIGDPPFPLAAQISPAETTPLPELEWLSSNPNIAHVIGTATSVNGVYVGELFAIAPGETTITVRTENGLTDRATVIVTATPSSFVPVTRITPSAIEAAMGAEIELNDLVTIEPQNATNQAITWRIDRELSTLDASIGVSSGALIIPWGETGTVIVEATVPRGRADSTGPWGYDVDIPFVHRITINVTGFVPVISITDVPASAFVSKPLQLVGTVLPAGASYRTIEWEIDPEDSGETDAYIDPLTGMLIAQNPGMVTVVATIKNGLMEVSTGGMVMSGTDFVRKFIIRVSPYNPNTLTVRAEPGGTAGGSGEFAGGEVATLWATPNSGYIFAGWFSPDGGSFDDSSRAGAEYTMPGNEATVLAFFAFVGAPGGVITVPQHPSDHFTQGGFYTRGSVAEYSHVTRMNFVLFSHVTVNGGILSPDVHYRVSRTPGDGHTMVTLTNSYLDSLEPGVYTLAVYFTDGAAGHGPAGNVRVTRSFTVRTETAAVPAMQTYDDVYISAWYFSSIEFVTERGWMPPRASEPRIFRPDASVTQGEAIDAIYRMAGSPTVTSPEGQPLRDREAALEWMLSNAIMPVGGQYVLDAAISRQDVVQLLSKLAGLFRLSFPVMRGAPSFADEWAIDSSVRSAVTTFYRAEIFNGRTGNTFVPHGNMTRAEFAVALHRYTNATR